MYVYTCTDVCMTVHMCVYMLVCAHVHIYLYICVFVCMCECVCMQVGIGYVCVCTCMYMCVFVCMCVDVWGRVETDLGELPEMRPGKCPGTRDHKVL